MRKISQTSNLLCPLNSFESFVTDYLQSYVSETVEYKEGMSKLVADSRAAEKPHVPSFSAFLLCVS